MAGNDHRQGLEQCGGIVFPVYKRKMRHCIVMEFNGNGLTSDGVKPGAGSVIFFCGRAGELTPTNGDIYIQDSDMLKILSYLDKSKAPVIAVRSKGE